MIRTIFILAIFYFLFSCEKEIDIKIDTEPFIVVNSFFTPDSTFKLNISESSTVFDNYNIDFIDNASVLLYENKNFIGEFTYISYGNYEINHIPASQKEYKIKISSPPDYYCEAVNIIPQKTEILSIDTFTDITNPYDLICKIRFEDNQNNRDFYFLEIRTISGSYIIEYPIGNFDTIFHEESINFNYTDNIIENKIGTDDLIYGAIFSDERINGKEKEILIIINKSSIADIPNNAIKFYLKNISEDYYFYAKSYGKLLNEKLDILAEPVQVYSNISGGFGIFGGYNQSVDSIIYNKDW